MDHIYHRLASLLLDVDKQLRDMSLWSEMPPSAEAMASVEPFAVDTMSFEQWLQFIFLPQMYRLVELGAELPANCAVAPMAEEFFSHKSDASHQLLTSLEEIDLLISENAN